MTTKLYSQTQSEQRADENASCRQIVREITNFGITQRQSMFLIYLLASELENVEHMQVITQLVKELGGQELFVGDINITGGANDGKTSV
jgi:hypothetical protein